MVRNSERPAFRLFIRTEINRNKLLGQVAQVLHDARLLSDRHAYQVRVALRTQLIPQQLPVSNKVNQNFF